MTGYLGIPFNSPYQFVKFFVEGVLRIIFCDIIWPTDSESCLNMLWSFVTNGASEVIFDMGQWFRISCYFLKIYYVLLLVVGYLGIPFNSPYRFVKFWLREF